MTYDVVIIGAGQRGLSLLERISALYAADKFPFELKIHVIDPGIPGQGVHKQRQPIHLITNTTTVQTTIFLDHSVENAGPIRPGPTYAEWLWLAGFRKNGEFPHNEGPPIPDDTYTPRAHLGQYLHWAYTHIVASRPKGLEIAAHRASAISIRKHPEDRYDIGLSDDRVLSADYIFVTTGHGSGSVTKADFCFGLEVAGLKHKNSLLSFIPSASSLDELQAIPPEAKVLICGTGLTSADVVSILTKGRSGRFEFRSSRRLVYIKSGNEPSISLYSRQGLPAGAKGVNQKTIGANYVPRHFTESAIKIKRDELGQLDWNRDLLPLLILEIKECCLATLKFAGTTENPKYGVAEIDRLVDGLLDPWLGNSISNPIEHADFITGLLADDIDAAFAGNRYDPFKAVSEMLRDLNDVVRSCVDYAGLTPNSHRKFLREWVSVNNRIAAGPPKERNMELLALIEAGIISILPPNPEVDLDQGTGHFVARSNSFGYQSEAYFDVLIRARVDPFDIETTTNPFFVSGRDEGIFSPFKNGNFAPGGLAIDRMLNVVDRDGNPSRSIWAMGFVAEGAHYYTYVLPCPFSNSRSLRDAALAVKSMLSDACSKRRKSFVFS